MVPLAGRRGSAIVEAGNAEKVLGKTELLTESFISITLKRENENHHAN
jgi:hypothetical protein